MRGTFNAVIVSLSSSVEQQITSNTYKLDYLIILFTMIYAGKQATTADPFVRHMLYVIM